MPTAGARYPLALVALAAVYVAAGRIGLELDAVSGFATLVWAPSGIALAALLAGGVRLWPGVAIGAFAVNVWVGASIPLALTISFGNTLAAVAATAALRRIPDFDPSLARVGDVLALIVVGAALSPVVSATIGATGLRVAGVATAERFGVTWEAWWIGDAIGDLVVAPLLLTWAFRRNVYPGSRLGEAVVLAFALVVAAALVFAVTPQSTAAFVLPYMLFPFLIWAALRLHLRGATTSTFVVSVIAIWDTARGVGPFIDGALFQRLGALHAFIAVMALTSLVLGAIAAERDSADQQLRLARDAAEAASRAKSRFLAVVSHELRTPLNGILGYSDLLIEGIAGSLSDQQHTYASRIRAAAWHLVSIIDGILTFSRGDARRHELRLETVDASALVHDAIALLAPHVDARHLDVRLSLPAAPVLMHTDAGKVRQILVNIIGNAVKFTSGNAIEVTADTDGDRVAFHVRDHGPGIPGDQLERIFEPFTQLAAAHPQLPAGTGLGLPVSRMLAELLGGSVCVESSPGDGSTFTILLPAVTGPAASGSS
jgi:signal transduction histidine kinase